MPESDRVRVTFCDHCGGEVQWQAIRCKHCGKKREPGDPSEASAAQVEEQRRQADADRIAELEHWQSEQAVEARRRESAAEAHRQMVEAQQKRQAEIAAYDRATGTPNWTFVHSMWALGIVGFAISAIAGESDDRGTWPWMWIGSGLVSISALGALVRSAILSALRTRAQEESRGRAP